MVHRVNTLRIFRTTGVIDPTSTRSQPEDLETQTQRFNAVDIYRMLNGVDIKTLVLSIFFFKSKNANQSILVRSVQGGWSSVPGFS